MRLGSTQRHSPTVRVELGDNAYSSSDSLLVGIISGVTGSQDRLGQSRTYRSQQVSEDLARQSCAIGNSTPGQRGGQSQSYPECVEGACTVAMDPLEEDMVNVSSLNIMAVVCHPADAIDGAGGTLCLHAARGDRVTVVVCTHGVDTHDWERNDTLRGAIGPSALDHSKALGRKEREVVEGMRILGIEDIRFLRFPDDLLMVSQELIESIATAMAEVQPHLLVLHNPTEELGLADVGHADSAIAALKAHYMANTPRFLEGKPACGRRFPAQVFFMLMNGKTTVLTAHGERWGNILVDITPVVERKVQAMDCLKSQYYPGEAARKCIEDVNGRMGLHARIPYAEAFQSYYPDVYSNLPANSYLLDLAATPMREQFERIRIRVSDVPYAAEFRDG